MVERNKEEPPKKTPKRRGGMLVMKRRVLDTIVIDDNIVVTVLYIGRGRVDLGIVAPQETLILREELKYKDKPNKKKR